jgi:hypothetical protein
LFELRKDPKPLLELQFRAPIGFLITMRAT